MNGGRSIALTTVAAVAALGVVVSWLMKWDMPLPPFVANAGPAGWSGHTLTAEFVPLAGILIALFTLRWWAWTLLAGVVVSLPMAVFALVPSLSVHVSVEIAAHAGPAMVLIAVLGAAQALFRQGARAAGILVAGLAVGVQVFAAALIGSPWLGSFEGKTSWQLAFTVVGLGGAVLAVLTVRLRSDWTPPERMRPRLAVAAVGAVLLPMAAYSVDNTLIADLLGVSPGSLARHPDVLPAIVGLGILVGAVLLAALAGARVFFGVAVMGLVQLSANAPLMLALYAAAFDPVSRWIAAALGVAAGCVAAVSPRRTPIAAGLGVLTGLVLLITAFATGGTPEKLIDQRLSVVGSVLLALLAATITLMVAAVAPVPAERDALAVAAGPLTSVLVLGGSGVLVVTAPYDPANHGYLDPAHHLGVSAGLLLVAAVLIAGAAGVRFLRTRPQPVLG